MGEGISQGTHKTQHKLGPSTPKYFLVRSSEPVVTRILEGDYQMPGPTGTGKGSRGDATDCGDKFGGGGDHAHFHP